MAGGKRQLARQDYDEDSGGSDGRDGFAPGNFSHRRAALCGNRVPEDLHQRINRPNLKCGWARGANTGFLQEGGGDKDEDYTRP